MRWVLGLAGAMAGCGLASMAFAAPASHQLLDVTVGPGVSAPEGGRLLVFAEPVAAAEARAKGGPLRSVDIHNVAGPGQTVAATEVARATPGAHLAIDLDQTAYPAGFSHLPPGEYAVQAALDIHHTYNYGGREAGDLVSPVVRLRLPLDAAAPAVTLDRAVPPDDPWVQPWKKGREADALVAAKPHVAKVAFQSPALTAFWGRPITMQAWVVTPPGYDPHGKATYPVVYSSHGFGAADSDLVSRASDMYAAMAAGRTPPMIWVFLVYSGPWGTTEFADSVNNGPWGKAFAEELVPDLERRYRMDARPNGRFLTGHSSGGWASLWLQIRYPKQFGGTWATSPDPSDFHDFLGTDLYAPHANLYAATDGTKHPMMRDGGKVAATMEEFARLEAVLGPSGGQMASFDWVFSPRGADGRPLPMFDRDTGEVDPVVLAYWRDHYDIAHLLQTNWPRLKPDLDGKIRVTVGAADSFYLDGAAHRLQAVLDGLGAKSRFQYVPGGTHFSLYQAGDNPWSLLEAYAWEMHAIARPGSHPPSHATR